ncbi:hypothetical protein IW140_000296 [Coemansia sp. RSA 1813]|nr:hypothetical protein LPJ74_000278 [Coemansia sp. RSA 1843]KAJ2217910.1 hypothetical protein EV179_000054 [Coemansia sp. RSA 487]KAJ2573252.1 hypothetical protein IW140_000296 [Coemansia sp. RSA 1813]
MLLSIQGASAIKHVAREGNLDGSPTVSKSSTAWRTYACMVPFTASDGTPLLMLYGGSNSQSAQDPLTIAASGESGLHVFDENTSTWYAPKTANAPAKGPVLPGCGAADGNAWVYDPHYGETSQNSAPVSLLDSVHWSWSSPTEGGQLPVTRFGAAFAYVPSGGQFYMHGGIPLSANSNEADDPPGIANNLDILKPTDLSWSYASNGPARKYHSLCYISSIDSLVLFGGSDQNIASYNDVKVFAIKSNTWQYSLKISGDVPAERVLHSAVCTNDSMVMFGGTNKVGDTPSDSTVWVLTARNEAEFTWSKAPIANTDQYMGPTARAGHSASLRDNGMYIYGGIGPSGQDSVMYKLDMTQWKWSQTNVTGSSPGAKDSHNTKTAVLIAAIVSSVLGIITVGISATVIYRFVRRRYGFFARHEGEDDHGHGGIGSDSEDEDEHDAMVPAYAAGDYERRDTGDSLYLNHGSGTYAPRNGAVEKPGAAMLREYKPDAGDLIAVDDNTLTKQTSTGLHSPADRTEPLNGESDMATPASIGTEQGLLPAVLAAGSMPSSPSSRMLDTMRAHARSLSTRLAPSRFSAAFGDSTPIGTDTLPPTAATVGRARRAGTSASTAHPRRRSAYANQKRAVNIFGHDQVRMENEYRHAEAINDILLSEQPIPAWLREAVAQARQANSEADNGRQDHMSEGSPAEQRGGRSASDANMSTSNSPTRTAFKVVNNTGM